MRKLSAKWVPKCLNVDKKNVNSASCLSNFWNFFAAIHMISCRDWWPWTKPGYITMARRQSNSQWSGGIVAHPTPKNSECENPMEKFSPRLFGIKTASCSVIIFQRAKLSTRSITHLCWCRWRTFWRKNAAGSHQVSLVLARQCPGSPGSCTSRILITHPILRIWPRRTTNCSLDWKHNWNVTILLPRRPGWTDKLLIFFSGLQKLEQGDKTYWASWGVCWINPEFGRSSSFPSWSV